MGAVSKALRRPALAAAVIGVALLLLALPAIGLRTGPPSPEQLPTSSQARQDTEAIAAAIGAGWDAPYLVVVASPRGPITTPRHLASVERVERRIAADPGVQAVIGIGRIDHRTAPLREEGNELLAGEGEASPERLAELGASLDRAAGGVGRLRGGIAEASAGAGLLGSGSARAGEGASRISDAAGRAASAARRALGALGRLDHGSARLAEGQRQAALGSRALRDELAGLMPVIRSGAIRPARRLRAELRAAAATDPSLRSALRDAEGVLEALTLARNQANRARVGAVRLHRGQRQLAGGGERLHSGVSRLSDAAAALPSGLARLGGGAAELSQGLQRLTGGADALSRNLAAGFDRSQPLQGGLDRARTKVKGSAARLSRKVDALRQGSPGIFDSGYFTLSALAGAPAADRRRAGEVLDLTGGGQAAQLVVVPRSTFNTPGSRALNRRLTSYAASLMGEGGLQAGVTGGPALVDDYDEAISARVPLVVLVTTLATFVVLLLVLRALPLAAIAVGLNLLTVAVAFGVLTLLFDVPAGWPLGGHTYVDSIGAAGIFGIIFGLSIDYAVFLLVRVRECRDRGASNATAITEGLGRTAGVITGAAAIMLIVFVAFAGAPIATVSQLGTGLAIAVLLDATVVRLVLLPALMLLVGDRVWWLPAGLGRVLPKLGTARG